jgi:hypothetical protein
MNDLRDLAERLHDEKCVSNHTDGCDWYYNPGYERRKQLAHAKKLMRIFGYRNSLRLLRCRKKLIQWLNLMIFVLLLVGCAPVSDQVPYCGYNPSTEVYAIEHSLEITERICNQHGCAYILGVRAWLHNPTDQDAMTNVKCEFWVNGWHVGDLVQTRVTIDASSSKMLEFREHAAGQMYSFEADCGVWK